MTDVILAVTPNPCVDKTVFIDTIEVGTFMRASRFSCVPGGKGNNVARAVHTMGRAAKAFMVVGGHTGAHVVDMIQHDDGVEAVPVWVQSPTRTITTVLEESVHRQTAFFEPGSRITPEEEQAIRTVFANAVQGTTVVTFNGTVSDKSIQTLYRDLVPIAKAAGALTILDTHGPELAHGIDAAPYMVKPNVAEAAELVGYPLDTLEAKHDALAFFHQRGVSLVVLSMGKEGFLVSDGAKRYHVLPPAIEEINPVGSGDCLVAGFAIGLMEGLSLEETATLGCAMGTANAMTWNIGHFDLQQLPFLRDRVVLQPT